ncbi:MAG TPA: hypothetical protein VF134_06455 [Candidatus Dormibacteraeota bacterium]
MSNSYSDRPLADKLGLKPGQRVRLIDLDERWFAALLAERGVKTGGRPPYDMVFFRVDDPAALGRLGELRELIAPAGAIWVLRIKGAGGVRPATHVRDTDIIEAAKGASLVDNKIASFSETLSAMRLVIPLALRPRKER